MKPRRNIRRATTKPGLKSPKPAETSSSAGELVHTLPVRLIDAQNVPEVAPELDLVSTALLKQQDINKFLLNAAGIKEEDLQLVVEQLRNALTANETKFFSFGGVVNDQRDVANWKVRLEAIEKFLKLFRLTGGQTKTLPSGSDVLKVEVDLAPGLKRGRT